MWTNMLKKEKACNNEKERIKHNNIITLYILVYNSIFFITFFLGGGRVTVKICIPYRSYCSRRAVHVGTIYTQLVSIRCHRCCSTKVSDDSNCYGYYVLRFRRKFFTRMHVLLTFGIYLERVCMCEFYVSSV